MSGAGLTPSAIKKSLRDGARLRLEAQTPEQVRAGSQRIFEAVEAWDVWRSARTVMMFSPLPGEPDVVLLGKSLLARGGRLCFPRTEWASRGMVPAAVTDFEASFEVKRHGIREPRPECPEVPVADLDLVLVPGLAFDPTGQRLGRGGGFYDRFLGRPELRAVLCGVLFDSQLVEPLPVEKHDVRVHFLAMPGEVRKT